MTQLVLIFSLLLCLPRRYNDSLTFWSGVFCEILNDNILNGIVVSFLCRWICAFMMYLKNSLDSWP